MYLRTPKEVLASPSARPDLPQGRMPEGRPRIPCVLEASPPPTKQRRASSIDTLGQADRFRALACRSYLHSAEVGFGVGADVGEAGRIGHAGGLDGVGVGPALALLEFDRVVVEQLIDGNRRQHERQ